MGGALRRRYPRGPVSANVVRLLSSWRAAAGRALASLPRSAWCAFFVGVSLALYARALDGWFLSDDSMIGYLIPDGEHVDWAHVLRTFSRDWAGGTALPYYRPLVVVTQAIDASIWGLSPLGFHLTNVILHGVGGYLLFELVRSFAMPLFAGVLAGVGFLVHPMHVESVVWISGRTDVLATALVLASLIAHRARTEGGGTKAFSASLLYALALASKESAVTVVPMIIAMDVILPLPRGAGWKRVTGALPAWALYGTITVIYLVVRSYALGDMSARSHSDWLEGWSRPDLLSAIRRGLYMLLTPLNRAQAGPTADDWILRCTAMGAVLLVVALLAIKLRKARWDVLAFAASAFVLSLVPVLHVFWIRDDLVSSRLAYAGTAWLSLGVAALVGGHSSLLARGAVLLQAVLYAAMLQMNQIPWIEAGRIIRVLRDQYAETFGRYVGEPIDGLPQMHKGAYLALYGTVVFVPPFIREPPKLQAVAAKEAVYHRGAESMRIVDDPGHGGARRLREALARDEWLWALEANPFDEASPKDLDPEEAQPPAIAAYRSTSKDPWINVPVPSPVDSEAPSGPMEDTVYLLMRASEPAVPELFWFHRGKRGHTGYVRLRPDLGVRDGQLAPALVDGFAVYSSPLDSHRKWRGLSRVSEFRLDPVAAEGHIEIRLFNVATRPASVEDARDSDVPAPGAPHP